MSHTPNTPSVSLELAAHRVVVLSNSESTFELTFRRLTDDDWLAFYDAITIAVQREGADQVKVIDFDSPSLALFDRAIVAATGYKVAGGGQLMDLPNWKTRVPLAHRLKAAEMLAKVNASTGGYESDEIAPEGEIVYVDAITGPAQDGASMRMVSDLKHILQMPTEQQHRRYARESSRSRVLGGARTGTTLYPGAQAVLADLYDELVVSVDGYTVGGKPLEGAEAIVREMDMHHKVVAAQQLFTPQGFVVEKVEEATA